MFDTIIRGGTVIDGTGRPGFTADVGITAGKIAAVGALPAAPASRVIDASGRVVTPGFIDIHRHADAAAFRPGYGELELRQGLTTIVNGNCGLSAAPFGGAHAAAIRAYLRPITGDIPAALPSASMADYLAALPRLVVNDLWITVSAGTCAKRVTLNGFYGPGRIWIQTNGAAIKCTAGLLINRCGCHVYVTGLTVSGGPVYDRSVVCAYASSHVSLSACIVDGLGATNVTGVISTVGSLMELTGCTIRNTTRYAVESSCASICAVSDAAASGNTVGGNVWRGGVLLLCGSTPQLLGGANNRKAGGLIAAHSGTLL